MLNNVDTKAANEQCQFYRVPFLDFGPMTKSEEVRIDSLLTFKSSLVFLNIIPSITCFLNIAYKLELWASIGEILWPT